MFEVPDIYVPVARIWSSDRAVPVPPAVSGGGGAGQRPAWGAAGPQEVGLVGTDRRLGRGGADRRLEPVRTAVSPSGRWRLAYPLAVSLAGGGLLLAMVPSGVRALLAAPRPIAVLGALTLVAALVPSLAAHARGARPSPTDLEPGALAQPFGFAILLGWGIAAAVLVAANALAAAEPGLGGGSPAAELRRRLGLGTWTSALLLGLAPAIVVVAERRLPLTPLLLLPVAAVHLAARATLQAERAHELAERERARAQAAAEAMLATVSHELRAPLTVVLGSLDTLTTRDGALDAEQRRELVAMAGRQGERLKRLVEQLLEAARLEQAELGPASVSVIDAVKVARKAERATELGHPGRKVRLDAGRALPVLAAPETLLQVLTNLLDNAAKYSPAGTPIRLQARRRGGQAVIAVIDAGPGIPPGQRERIFERFTQLESSDGRRGEGAGLGLYIARKLARSLGGDLVLCEPSPSTPGTRFELRLPLADERPARVSEHEPDGDRSPRALAGGPVGSARRR